MNKRLHCFALCLILICLCLPISVKAAAPATAAKAAGPTNYVQDRAQVLDKDTALFFNQVSRELDKKAQSKVVLITTKSLKGVPIAMAAQKLFEQNKLSSASPNYNCLLLVSLQEKQQKLILGSGLKTWFPDDFTHQLLTVYLMPALQDEKYYNYDIRDTMGIIYKQIANGRQVTLSSLIGETVKPVIFPDETIPVTLDRLIPECLGFLALGGGALFILFALLAMFGWGPFMIFGLQPEPLLKKEELLTCIAGQANSTPVKPQDFSSEARPPQIIQETLPSKTAESPEKLVSAFARPELTEANLVKPNLKEPKLAKDDLVKPHLTEANSTKTNLATPKPVEPASVKAALVNHNPIISDPVKNYTPVPYAKNDHPDTHLYPSYPRCYPPRHKHGTGAKPSWSRSGSKGCRCGRFRRP